MTEPKTRRRVRRLRTAVHALVVALVVTAVGAVTGASPASAATGRNGVCEYGELCLWYDPGFAGSMVDMFNSTTPDDNFGDYDDVSHFNDTFVTPGRGRGQIVLNNAASARNADRFMRVNIYGSKFCTGTLLSLAPNAALPDLGSMQNNNESHCWRW